MYLNSLYEGQGLEQLVSASVRLPAHIHVATLGPEAQRGYLAHLLDYVDRQEAGARFHVLPPIAPDDMIAYASGADIGIVPRQNININNRLSLPNRVLEMVMARLPIATSRLPDIEALVAECELGLVFDETDPDDIAHVLQIMAEPERLAVFRMNADRAANDLSWENESKCYVAAIENTLAGAA